MNGGERRHHLPSNLFLPQAVRMLNDLCPGDERFAAALFDEMKALLREWDEVIGGDLCL